VSAFGVVLIGLGILTAWAGLKHEKVTDVFQAMFVGKAATTSAAQPHASLA